PPRSEMLFAPQRVNRISGEILINGTFNSRPAPNTTPVLTPLTFEFVSPTALVICFTPLQRSNAKPASRKGLTTGLGNRYLISSGNSQAVFALLVTKLSTRVAVAL